MAEDMKKALKAFQDGTSIRYATEFFKLSRIFLRHKVIKGNTTKSKGGQATATRIVSICESGAVLFTYKISGE